MTEFDLQPMCEWCCSEAVARIGQLGVDTGNCPGVGRLPKIAIRHRNVSADAAERFVETGSIWLWWMVSLNQCNGPSL
jgi:hypothetical protein